MNVGGVPWTTQKNPLMQEGFWNVIMICAVTLLLLLLCFAFPSLYAQIAAWRKKRALRSSSLNRKSIRTVFGRISESGGCVKIWEDGTLKILYKKHVYMSSNYGCSFTTICWSYQRGAISQQWGMWEGLSICSGRHKYCQWLLRLFWIHLLL